MSAPGAFDAVVIEAVVVQQRAAAAEMAQCTHCRGQLGWQSGHVRPIEESVFQKVVCMPPSTIPSIFNAISSPDPRCENSEAMLPRNGKALSQPHDAWPVLAFGAYLLRCRDKAGA